MINRNMALVLSVALILSLPSSASAQTATTVISGTVRSQSGRPLPGVQIRVESSDLSDIVTKADGTYSFVVVGMKEVTLRFSLKRYQPLTRTLLLNGGKANLDVQITSLETEIQMTSFVRAQRIEGKVLGLEPHSYAAYKIVAYVLTNKWYIHPEAVNTPGLGFALIDSNGNWRLQTVWRGYQATKLAFLLVPREAWAPPTVELTGNRPESALLAQIEGVESSLFLEAPEGI